MNANQETTALVAYALAPRPDFEAAPDGLVRPPYQGVCTGLPTHGDTRPQVRRANRAANKAARAARKRNRG
jgi:hypothetical protein